MIRRVKEFTQKALILAGTTILCGSIGFYVPVLTVSHDVAAAMAATIFAAVGAVVGLAIGWILVRRNFD